VKFLLFIVALFLLPIHSGAQQVVFGGQIVVSNPRETPVTYVPSAAKFDGDYFVHTGDFTGIVDTNVFTIAFWFKLNDAAQDGTMRRMAEFGGISAGVAGVMRVNIDAANKVAVSAQNVAGTTVVNNKSSTSYVASTNWHFLYASTDLSAEANNYLYVDGVNERNTTTFVEGSTIDFANAGNFGFMARGTDGNGITKASISEVWFDTIFLPPSQNIPLFLDNGHPADIGPTGNLITGTTPILYLKNGFATFQNNLGTGGNYTVTGSLENDPNIP